MSTSKMLRDLTPYFLFLLLTATLGPLLFGYHLAELNAPSDVITCKKSSISIIGHTLSRLRAAISITSTSVAATSTALPQCIPMNPTQFGLVSSFFTLGGLIGALAAGPLTAKFGRIRTMLYAAILATIGPAFEALAPNIGTITLGRTVSGLGAGAAMVVVPIYIADIAPPENKGFFGSFTQVMVNMGILITQVLGYFLSKGQLWRIILAAAGGIALVQASALVLGGQESPKWMVDSGQPAKAKRVLRKIRGHEADIEAEVEAWGESSRDEEDEEETLLSNEDRIHHGSNKHDGGASDLPDPTAERDQSNATQSKSRKAAHKTAKATLGAFEVLTEPLTRPAVFAITMIMLAQQLTGINSIIMYGVSLLSDLLAANSALLNIFVSLLNVLITAAAAPLVDKLGRKTCLLMSITGMGVNSVLLAIGIMRSIPILSAVAVILFVSSFGLGLGPVPFILPSELVDASAVGSTQSWALAANWIATFVVAQFFPILNDAMGKGQVYFIFAGMAVFFGGFVAWFVPETKGKKNAEEVWGRKKTGSLED